MAYKDLREWLNLVEEKGELKKIDGASWDLEMGAITEIIYKEGKSAVPPAVLFDKVPGYAEGFRTLFGLTTSPKRMALTLGLPEAKSDLDVVRAYRDKLKDLKPIPPRVVQDGPVLENVDRGDDVNLFKFPVPLMHELDGGRYIGTACLVITKDPDEGWVNFGAYRGMVHDEKSMAFYVSPGKHGMLHRQKYFDRGQPCPVVVCVGADPLLFLASGNEIPYGLSEYDYAGGFKGEPIDVVLGEYTGLPIPANAEIVIEGEAIPGDNLGEGPFGEWTGYYASAGRPEPVIRVKNVYYRNNPILCCARPGRPPSDYSYSKCVVKSALIWDELEKIGVPNVQGVWCHEAGGGRMFNTVSIKQAYPGHSRQAGLVAAGSHAGNYLGRYVVVVDEDIDPSNTFDVLWAIASRSEPTESIEIIRKCWSGPLDPRIPVGSKGFNSRAIIDACRPYDWKDKFPPVVESSPELREKTLQKWEDSLFE
ncbi:UbiD family decarboxylase [Paradesulfitobacterium aromaticivorans]